MSGRTGSRPGRSRGVGPEEGGQDPFRRRRQVVDPGAGRIVDRGDDGRGADVHRELADALGAVRRVIEPGLDEDRLDPGRIERGRDDVRLEPVVQVAAVAQLDLLDRRVADGLERPAFDLPFAQHRVDDPTHVIDRDDRQDGDLAGVEIDLDFGHRGCPAEAG